MPSGFIHLISAWLVGKLYGKLRKPLPLELLGLMVFAGAAPDADFILEWGFGIPFHRYVTHSIFGIIASSALIYVLVRYGLLAWAHQKKEFAKYSALAWAAGYTIHIILDAATDHVGVPFLWPLAVNISQSGIYFGPVMRDPVLTFRALEFLADTIIGAIWVFFLWIRGHIKF